MNDLKLLLLASSTGGLGIGRLAQAAGADGMKGCVVGQNGVVGLKALALAAAFVGKNEGVVTCQGALGGAVGAFGVYVGGVGVGV